jgi:hypothetical protein
LKYPLVAGTLTDRVAVATATSAVKTATRLTFLAKLVTLEIGNV